jgi:hypothetical protein
MFFGEREKGEKNSKEKIQDWIGLFCTCQFVIEREKKRY